MKYTRAKELFGDNYNKLQNSKIIIIGVGGVGGYALDCLYRTGITNITIVDFDRFDITNQNRQIGSENIDTPKVEALKKLYPKITAINKKITTQWVEQFDFEQYDVIVDAIDDINPKIALILKYYHKLISSTGSAKRIDSLQIEYIDIFKTYNDPFAKKIRTELKKHKFNKKFKVIFSKELPQCNNMGSFVGVTGSFGLAMCSQVIKKLIK